MEQRKENKMGVMPVNKLLISISLPIMISMLVQALYNIVDSIFVSRVGENALTSVSLGFPIQMFMVSMAVGTGIGINSLLSRRLGEKKFDDANTTAKNGIFISIINSLIFASFGIFFSRMFFKGFTDNVEIINMGTKYISICTIFSMGMFLQITNERLLQATGISVYSMITQIAGAVINIILDPIFIFGLKLGVTGAAIATVIGQFVAMGLGLYFNITKNKEINLNFKDFKPNKNIIKEIYKVGFPAIVMQSIASVMIIGMNKILILFSETAVAVLGIYFKLQSFVFMPTFGLTSGLIPIIGFNYGAKKKERIVKAIKFSLIYAICIMLIGTLIFQLIPDKLLLLFDASDEMLSIGIPALRIISICFIFASVSIVFSSVFQAMGNGIFSLIISVVRMLVIILPASYLLAKYVGLNYLWFAYPISEIVSIFMSTTMFRHVYNKYIKNIKEDN